jgi:glycosyltransferase involved in cell wall biosynthesis
MRIVIDMQGAQTESRFRGIGRYTLSFAQAIVRNRGEHEVMLALSGLFPDTIESIRTSFDDLLPQENIRVWDAPGPVKECEAGNEWRREAAELIREAFLASLRPDVIHVTSLFEGYVDDAVTSIGRFDRNTLVSVSLYDLIPLLNPDHYLRPNPRYAQYYQRKVEYLGRSSVYLTISEFTRQEGLAHLDVTGSRVVNISTAIENHFQPCSKHGDIAARLRQKFGLRRPFVLYTGGADERKNLPRLIEAYATLPTVIRARHQLVLAGKINIIEQLKHIAHSAGLKDDELCFTGYVTDDELVLLYNLCQIYVFPSWQEGFGLPALEAMACGASVVGANTSSLPEVIGLEEALFDPFNVPAISQKMAQVLGDENFRNRLREHGLQKAKEYSWDETGKRAIKAWESMPPKQALAVDFSARSVVHSQFINALAVYGQSIDEPHLLSLAACLAQNESAGVERQLMLDVSELCQRDAATGVQRVVRSYLKCLLQSPPVGLRIEPVYASQSQGYHYARAFTQRFLGLEITNSSDDMVRWQRGDIFFGLDMQHHVQLAHADFYKQIKREGVTVKFLIYDLLPIQFPDFFKETDAKNLHEQWLAMIASTDGAICISKTTADAYDGWLAQCAVRRSPTFSTSWIHIGADIQESNPSNGLPIDAGKILDAMRLRPTLLCVSTIEPRKRQQQVLEAIEFLWQEGAELNLVFVGKQGWKTDALSKRLRGHTEHGSRLYWLESISDEYLEKIYASSTCLVAASINEGFGLSLIEAARHGIPIVARDIPVFREVAGNHAYYFRGDTAQELAVAIKNWMGLYMAEKHPRSKAMPWLTWKKSAENLKCKLVEQNYPRRQLLVDISELAKHDTKTGIQRVVRSIVKEWLTNPPDGYRVEPVYSVKGQGYRYARKLTARFLDTPDNACTEDLVDHTPGDVFFGLDLNHHVLRGQKIFLEDMRRNGVDVRFMVYDLLPIQFPEFWEPQYSFHLVAEEWLSLITNFDGAVCISKAVANDLVEWMKTNTLPRLLPFKIDWFHLGADIDNSHPTKGLPDDAATTLAKLRTRSSFLMVGTLEPRKGHTQVLDAFEQLWTLGFDSNLVIVGKKGWMVEELIARLYAHPDLGKRLFWLEGISDEYLEKVYSTSICLIAASYGEGFGLPLIEAAQHKVPIIARDIPVFREVAGEYAYYFDGASADGLAQAIKIWLSLYEEKKHPQSDLIQPLTWQESARQLSDVVLSKTRNKQTLV